MTRGYRVLVVLRTLRELMRVDVSRVPDAASRRVYRLDPWLGLALAALPVLTALAGLVLVVLAAA